MTTIFSESHHSDRRTAVFFVITSDEDGLSIRQMTRAELSTELEPDPDLGVFGSGKGVEPNFLDIVPVIDKGHFTGNNSKGILIIRGEIVSPEPETEVTKWKLPETAT